MKSGTAFITGIFISISAVFFFRQEEKLFRFLSAKEAVNPASGKSNSVQKKKPPVSTTAKTKSSAGNQPVKSVYPSAFFTIPPITAIKTVDKTANAISEDVLSYTVTITNNGATDETGLSFTDNIDPNTTLVPGSLKFSPVAANDAYTAIGNVGISVPDANGILVNDQLGSNPAATFTPVINAATAQGGVISITAGGAITYTPAVGFTGNDTYDYTLSNDAGSSTATITIAVSGMIWFVNNASVAATADGRVNTPFKTVAALQAINDGATSHPAANHFIFVHESATDYTGNISLLSGQKLIGQDATTDLATITGYNTFPFSTALLPALNSANGVIVNLTASGADNVISLVGGGSATYIIRGLTIGNKATGSGINGTTFGTANISEASITGTGQALNLTTGVLDASFASVSSSSGANAVSLTGITGTVTMGTGSLAGSTGTTFNVSGGTVGITYSGNISQANNAALVNVAGSHSGTITFQTGTLSATNGTGLQFSSANGTYNFNGTNTLNGGDAGVDIVGTSTGSFSFSAATSITNPSGNAFVIGAAGVSTGGSGPVTYNGTISKNNAGRVIEIQNKTAGTVAFTGSVASTGTSSGINLLTNTGTTINFSGGLNLNTSTNTAFNATGGGTISATQNNSTILNTITTTTGSGVNVANTTIGAGGLTFRSINVNGASKAVSLNTTGSGGFTISGTGTAGTGGTIQNIGTRGLEFISANNISLSYLTLTNANTTNGASPCDDNGNGGCNAALYASTVTGLSLNTVNITTTAQQGANLNNVTTLTIANCLWQGNGNETQESAIKARNILGNSSITSSTFKNSAHRIAHVINTSGTAHLTIDGCTFTNDAFDPASPAGILKQDCFEMRTQSTAVATVIIKNSTFQRAGSYGIQMAAEGTSNMTLAITNCIVDRGGQQMAGIAAIADGASAVMNANIDGNPLIQAAKEVSVNVASGIGGAMQATVRNNTSIQGGNNANQNAFANVYFQALEQSNSKVLMTGSKVEFTDEQGILVATHDGSTNTMNGTVDGNTIITQNVAGNLSGFVTQVLSNSLVNTASPACANIKNNAVTMTIIGPSRPFVFEVETGAAASQINLQSNSGTNQTTINNLWVNNANTSNDQTRLLEQKTPGSIINYGGAFTCLQPANIVLPSVAPPSGGNVVASASLADIPVTETIASVSSEEKQVLVEEPLIEPGTETLSQLGTMETNTALSLTETTTSDNVTVSGINLPSLKSITIKFEATVNNNLATNVCAVSNQGSVTGGTIVSPVLTDNDNDLSNGINPTVTTIKDETAPQLTCPTPVTVTETSPGAGTSVNFEATATDNCTQNLTPQYFIGPTEIFSPHTFPVGTTTVDVMVKDAANNPANCSFTVTVNPACQVNCPANVTVDVDAGQCGAIVNYNATTTGDCGTLTYSHNSGDFFPVGTTMVTVSSSSTGQSCQFAVTVNDVEDPQITCPDNKSVGTDPDVCTASVVLDATPVDNCPTGLQVKYFIGATEISSGHNFPTGTTTVTAKAIDGTGNEATCTFTVTVTDDQNPSITAPDDISANTLGITNQCGRVIMDLGTPTKSDNCGTPTLQILGLPAGNLFPVGTTTLTYQVTDGEGNISTDEQKVTVTDIARPVILNCPTNITAFTGSRNSCDKDVTWTEPTASDNCGVASFTSNHNPGEVFPVGTTTVIYTAVDVYGNQETCSFTVTVNDDSPPEISGCPSDITVYTGMGATSCTQTATWTEPTAVDNCEGPVDYVERTHAPGDNFPVGKTTVRYTFQDSKGFSRDCIFDVTVVDNTPPVISNCPGNIVETLTSGSGCTKSVSWTAPTASDNCGGYQLSTDHAPGTSFPVGITAVKYIATDNHQNTAECSFTVEVKDGVAPTFTTNLTASPLVLWPPDHKMRDITLTYATADNCTGTVTNNVVVTSTDPISGVTDGDKFPDWEVVNDHFVRLRAERGKGREARIYTITVTPVDASGNQGIPQSVNIYIAHNIVGPLTGTPFKIGSTVNLAGVFWDKPGNKHTANWTIDGSTTVKATVTEPSGARNGKVTGSYKFTSAGVYKLQMNIIDQNKLTSYCNTNEDLEAIVVIYDPNGGYVYGGGQFASPAGALKSDATATGLVSYGFTVNYYRNATLPKGETQFEFKVGDFEFNALNFEYLSINGATAQFKGSGKIIGGQSGINFVMTTVDGQLDGTGVDKIKIRIYNKNTGQVYYDNEPGTSDAANPVTRVGPNSTVTISTSNIKTKDAPETIVTEPAQELYARAIPNPSTNNFSLSVSGGNVHETIIMQVFDGYGRLVDVRKTATASTLVIGDRYRPGTYYVRFSQGKLHKEIKLIKLPD